MLDNSKCADKTQKPFFLNHQYVLSVKLECPRKQTCFPHQDCNAKMVECPQCGHSLMNARNRTAEALAVRLVQLRGDRY